MNIFNDSQYHPYFLLFLSAVCGGALGSERQNAGHKEAGRRTLALVSLGSCLFSIMPMMMGVPDPWRVAGQVVTGIGFIGGGGGGGRTNVLSTGGAGGSGGGGTGGNGSTPTAGTAGTVNTGGGGGGGGFLDGVGGAAGGAGGSGVVILSVPTTSFSNTYSTSNATITTSGANKIMTFTSSGTYTA